MEMQCCQCNVAMFDAPWRYICKKCRAKFCKICAEKFKFLCPRLSPEEPEEGDKIGKCEGALEAH